MNRSKAEQAQIDARRRAVREALRDGPGEASQIAQRLGWLGREGTVQTVGVLIGMRKAGEVWRASKTRSNLGKHYDVWVWSLPGDTREVETPEIPGLRDRWQFPTSYPGHPDPQRIAQIGNIYRSCGISRVQIRTTKSS